MSRLITIVTALLVGVSSLTAQTPYERYSEAGELYNAGDYSGAAAAYKKLYEEGYRSADLLYNTGNAFFKSGDNASAVLFYERALLLAPADEDISYNLQIVRSRLTDRIEPLPGLFFVRWYDFVSLLLPTNSWAMTALLLFVVSLVMALLFLTRARARGHLLTFWLSVAAVTLSLLAVTLAIRNNSLINHNRKAVVTCSIVTGRSAPGETGNELFVLHSGTTVTVEQQLGTFLEVRLPDGNRGWLSADCIEKI